MALDTALCTRNRISALGVAIAAFAGGGAIANGQSSTELAPTGLLLSWQRDPTTTMTIDWHTLPADADRPSALVYRAEGSEPWQHATGDARPFPFCERSVHRVELTGLEPATIYEFRVGADDGDDDGASRLWRFRTMPELLPDLVEKPIRFATGGDIRHRRSWMDRANRVAMAHDLDFIVWGGDLAYADGREENLGRWHEFFDSILETLVADDDRVIPIVVGVGNHELRGHTVLDRASFDGSDAWRNTRAPYFYTLFAFPGHPGYNVLDFGDWLSLVVLDTDHTSLVAGAQTEWLERTLEARADRVRHIIPVQHVPAYPSVRAFEGETPLGGKISMRIREHWCPLFDRFGVRVVFENHDHAYKRTKRIRGNAVHPDGIVYIGDGAWGVRTRAIHDTAATWYLERAKRARHVLIVTLEPEAIEVVALLADEEVEGEDGEVIDRVRIAVPRSTGE